MTSNHDHQVDMEPGGTGSTPAPARMTPGARGADRGEYPPAGFACLARGAHATRAAGDLVC